MTHKEPTFNDDGEPTEETLNALATWPHASWDELVAYLGKAFEGYGFAKINGDELNIVTGGWSGNEMMIEALQKNQVFWAMCWKASHRGGKYVFDMERLLEAFEQKKP